MKDDLQKECLEALGQKQNATVWSEWTILFKENNYGTTFEVP